MNERPLDPLEEEALRRVRANLVRAIERHERAPRRRRTAVYAIGAGAAVAAAAGVYVVADRDRSETTVDTFHDEPTTTTTPRQVVVVPSTAVLATTSTIAAAERPEDFVAVTDDGRLVVVDATTGVERRELARRDDPRQPAGEGGPSVISGVAVDRAAGVVYYDTCCEPASGSVWAVPLDGGESRPVFNMSWPALSGDGSKLVGLAIDRVIVGDASGNVLANGIDPSYTIFHPSIAPDGTTVAYERNVEVDGGITSEIVVVDTTALAPPDASDEAQRLVLADARSFRDPEGVGWMHPAIQRDGKIVVVQQCCYGDVGDGARNARVLDPVTGEVIGSFEYPNAVLDQHYDASGTWLLVTLADGRVQWFGGGESGTFAQGFVAAAW